MKKNFKGFTLVELIIVMAIFTILMAAIMRMFTPIRETYVDSTLYETQRTAQNGIIQYITESVRYSTDMGIYNNGGGGVTTAQSAVDEFAAAYCSQYNITNATKIADVTALIKEKADVIVIDNSATEYGGKDCYGRLIRRKLVPTDLSVTDDYVNDPTKARLALGAAYYDDNTYSIGLDVTNKANGVLTVTVASTANHGARVLSKDANVDSATDLSTLDLISVSSDVVCRNLTSATSGNVKLGVKTAGMYDTAKYDNSSTVKGSKTFIVFIYSDLKSDLRALADA